MSEITENYILNGEGSRKETRHIVFDLGDSGLDYKVGDALGVLAENPPHIVEELLEAQGWDRETMVETHNGERDLYTALKKDFEVHLANKKFVQSLAHKVVSSGMRISLSIVSRSRNGEEWSASDSQALPPVLLLIKPRMTQWQRSKHWLMMRKLSKTIFGLEITSTSCVNLM